MKTCRSEIEEFSSKVNADRNQVFLSSKLPDGLESSNVGSENISLIYDARQHVSLT